MPIATCPRILVVATAMASFALSARASSVLDDLTADQKKRIHQGRQVVIAENVKGHVWPRVTVYQLIDAAPLQVAAVFCDYPRAKYFVPNVMKSEVSHVISPLVVEVDYGVKVPVLPDEFYTVRNSLSSLGNGGYAVDWKLLRAVQTKDSVGEFRMERLGDQTLVRYRNLTTPSSGMAGLLRGQAIEQMRKTVQAIAAEVMKQKTSNPSELHARAQAILAATDPDF